MFRATDGATVDMHDVRVAVEFELVIRLSAATSTGMEDSSAHAPIVGFHRRLRPCNGMATVAPQALSRVGGESARVASPGRGSALPLQISTLRGGNWIGP